MSLGAWNPRLRSPYRPTRYAGPNPGGPGAPGVTGRAVPPSQPASRLSGRPVSTVRSDRIHWQCAGQFLLREPVTAGEAASASTARVRRDRPSPILGLTDLLPYGTVRSPGLTGGRGGARGSPPGTHGHPGGPGLPRRGGTYRSTAPGRVRSGPPVTRRRRRGRVPADGPIRRCRIEHWAQQRAAGRSSARRGARGMMSTPGPRPGRIESDSEVQGGGLDSHRASLVAGCRLSLAACQAVSPGGAAGQSDDHGTVPVTVGPGRPDGRPRRPATVGHHADGGTVHGSDKFSGKLTRLAARAVIRKGRRTVTRSLGASESGGLGTVNL
eukprot:763020-Hanusia_phi.AAC.2